MGDYTANFTTLLTGHLGLNGNSDDGGNTHLTIKDTRKIDAASNVPITHKNRKDATVNPFLVRRIVRESKFHGIDPYTALAIAHQESGIEDKSYDKSRLFQVFDSSSDSDKDKDAVQLGIRALKEKIEYGKKLGKKTEADILQAYNGYGKIKYDKNVSPSFRAPKKMYGVDVSKGIDFSKNPIYGKRIIDLRDNVLKTNPDIVKLVNSELGNDESLVAPYKHPDNYKPLSVEQKTEWDKFLDYVNKQRGF